MVMAIHEDGGDQHPGGVTLVDGRGSDFGDDFRGRGGGIHRRSGSVLREGRKRQQERGQRRRSEKF